jgi:hypothetical protein
LVEFWHSNFREKKILPMFRTKDGNGYQLKLLPHITLFLRKFKLMVNNSSNINENIIFLKWPKLLHFKLVMWWLLYKQEFDPHESLVMLLKLVPDCRIPYCRLLLKMTKFHHIIFYLITNLKCNNFGHFRKIIFSLILEELLTISLNFLIKIWWLR